MHIFTSHFFFSMVYALLYFIFNFLLNWYKFFTELEKAQFSLSVYMNTVCFSFNPRPAMTAVKLLYNCFNLNKKCFVLLIPQSSANGRLVGVERAGWCNARRKPYLSNYTAALSFVPSRVFQMCFIPPLCLITLEQHYQLREADVLLWSTATPQVASIHLSACATAGSHSWSWTIHLHEWNGFGAGYVARGVGFCEIKCTRGRVCCYFLRQTDKADSKGEVKEHWQYWRKLQVKSTSSAKIKISNTVYPSGPSNGCSVAGRGEAQTEDGGSWWLWLCWLLWKVINASGQQML